MKIEFLKKHLNVHPEYFMVKQAGYKQISSYHTGQDSFVRTMGRDDYPRFHVYAENMEDRVIIDLHLDQKQASYQGSHAHNAEYDGEVVEVEVSRLKGLLNKLYQEQK